MKISRIIAEKKTISLCILNKLTTQATWLKDSCSLENGVIMVIFQWFSGIVPCVRKSSYSTTSFITNRNANKSKKHMTCLWNNCKPFSSSKYKRWKQKSRILSTVIKVVKFKSIEIWIDLSFSGFRQTTIIYLCLWKILMKRWP